MSTRLWTVPKSRKTARGRQRQQTSRIERGRLTGPPRFPCAYALDAIHAYKSWTSACSLALHAARGKTFFGGGKVLDSIA